MWGPELHCMFEKWADSGFVQWEDQFFDFVPEIASIEPRDFVGRFAAFLLMMIPRSRCWSFVGNCWLDML